MKKTDDKSINQSSNKKKPYLNFKLQPERTQSIDDSKNEVKSPLVSENSAFSFSHAVQNKKRVQKHKTSTLKIMDEFELNVDNILQPGVDFVLHKRTTKQTEFSQSDEMNNTNYDPESKAKRNSKNMHIKILS